MGDKSCYMGAGGYSGYMGSGTQGQGYAREEYAGNRNPNRKATMQETWADQITRHRATLRQSD
ncbi:hypothetical protein ANCCEY_05138 [Ancylostoma ceylanicum]|uniref:Uncharacterized protein n=1 Tax=Ancylostoma ceylanicum TaxID=53326 RepID=A0A0D6LUQ9_9BILA|nr:hypothetical protein ANCCEY_05138 [Ancylostoma ceylanicum]